MIIRSIDPNLPDEKVLEYAAKLIKAGGIVVFPSDSSYGLATDPANREAVERLFKLKGRPNEKAFSCIFRDLNQIEQWAEVRKHQEKILTKNLPGPFTFILQCRVACPLESETIGVRIPDNSVTKSLAYVVGIPFTATSANLSGQEPAYNLEEIFMNFEGQIYQPDLVLDAGPLPKYPPSAVVDITGSKPKTLRDGIAKLR